MLTPPAENRKKKEKEMLFRLQAAGKHIAYSACSALLPSRFFQLAPKEAVLI